MARSSVVAVVIGAGFGWLGHMGGVDRGAALGRPIPDLVLK